MSNSPLVSYTKISPNRYSPRNHVIDTITIHCVVGQVTVQQLGSTFGTKTRKASSNYGIGKDGKVGMYVEEKDASWCTSSKSNDMRAVTIEVASNVIHPYAVTSAAYESLIKLVADICKRNNIKRLYWEGNKALIGNIKRQNMTVHRWFANKACPGQYLYERHPDIVKRVNALLGVGDTKVSKPVETPSSALPYLVRVSASSLRIRRGPGTNYSISGVAKPGIYTIVAEGNGVGATRWGKLKNGSGWISLDYAPKYNSK